MGKPNHSGFPDKLNSSKVPGWRLDSECTLKGVASGFYDETIVRFQVRYVELSDWHLADSWFFDLDIAIEQRPIIGQQTRP